MRFSRTRYQHGSIRKVPRKVGFAWEWRWYETEDGKRKLKVQTFDSAKYPTQTAVEKAVAPLLKQINSDASQGVSKVTMDTIIDRYYKEKMKPGFLALSHSTQQTNRSNIELHIRPYWRKTRPNEIDRAAVKHWLAELPSPAIQLRAKIIMTALLDLAMEWKLMPEIPNPALRIPIEGAEKKEPYILTPEKFVRLVNALQEPHNIMVLVTGIMGFRIEETVALKWDDFNFKEYTVQLKRAFTHGRLGKLKTKATGKRRPVNPALAKALLRWKDKQEKSTNGNPDGWVFPSPMNGGPYCANTIQQRFLRPIAKALFGEDGFGWHALRHSHNSWQKTKKVSPAHLRDLMGYADISTPMNIYGGDMDMDSLRSEHLRVTDGVFQLLTDGK